MNLIFRKSDSATSLLMFVYNNYLALTHKDSIKLTSLLGYLQAFGKNESAVRMALSRAVKAGLLLNNKQDGEVFYSLSDEGKQAIQLWNEGVMQFWKRYRLRNEPWNGKWYFVHLHHASGEIDGYAEFTDKMEQLGFSVLHSNTWVSPYRNEEEVHRLIERFGIRDHLVEIDGEMTIHQELPQFLDDQFNIGHLRSLYRSYMDTFRPKFADFQKQIQDERFIENGHSLPLLNELGWNFFRIASGDIVLPRQLLGQWEQDEAVMLFKQFREALLPHIYDFLKKYE